MKEALLERPRQRNPDRPLLSDIEALAGGRVEVAKHEFAHVVAIWGVGKSVIKASVVATSQYLGVTIPGEGMSASQMQVAAMASAEHEGNGSDQLKADILQYDGGISMSQAEAIAKSIIRSYRKEVLHVAAMYLAAKGSATGSELRTFLRWAEEEVKEQDKWKDVPVPSWSAELNTKETDEDKEVKTDETENAKILYLENNMQKFIYADGQEEIFCLNCNTLNGHNDECPNQEKLRIIRRAEYTIFWPKNSEEFFSPN